jgi:hypothetical protein
MRINRATTIFIGTMVVIALAGCGSGINNFTVTDAAKTFIQAEIDGNYKVINEINGSNPLEFTPQYLLSLASNNGYSKHKIGEFKFEQVDDITVNVFGPKDIGDESLVFIKQNGQYFFNGIDGIK